MFKYRVLQVLPEMGMGGVPQGCLDLVKAIKQQGGQAYVSAHAGYRNAELKQLEGIFLPLPLHTKNPIKILANGFALARLIKLHNIDLIHARSRAPAWSALIAAKLTHIPFVTTFHGTYNFKSSLKKVYNSIMVRGDRVIAISNFIKSHILSNYQSYCRSDKISLIHRGIDLQHFSPDRITDSAMQQLRQDWQVNDSQLLILVPGRLSRWKGQLQVLKALSLFDHHKFKCVFVGSDQGRTHYRQELQDFAIINRIADDVHFQDHYDNMPLAYATADVIIHAATDPEAFGRVVAEAQAMGKPVIASTHGAPAEIIIDNETGWLCPPDDVNQMVDKIIYISQLTPLENESVAKKARDNIINHFSYELMVQKTLNVYQELLQQDRWKKR